jgi:hypothetical protein
LRGTEHGEGTHLGLGVGGGAKSDDDSGFPTAMLGQEDKGRLRASHELLVWEEICAWEKGEWWQQPMTFKGHRSGMGWGWQLARCGTTRRGDVGWGVRTDQWAAVVGSDALPVDVGGASQTGDWGCRHVGPGIQCPGLI